MFKRRFQQEEQEQRVNIWIIKPGECTNRGTGIQVSRDVEDIKSIMWEGVSQKICKTYIIQKYMDSPLLYQKRKFDIRCFMLAHSQNNQLKAYWYQEGYVRTSGLPFSLENVHDKLVHLTNDSVQKNSETYGKYEPANKVSFPEFSRYLEATHKVSFEPMYQKMRRMA